MKLEYLSESHKGEWERLVAATPESGFMQSWDWSLYKEAEGQRVLRIGVFDQGCLVAGAMVYYVSSSAMSSPLELPHGPVLPWQDESKARECMAHIRAELGRKAREIGTPLIRMEPMISGRFPEYFGALVRSPVDLIPNHTLLIPIDRNDNDLLRSMTAKGRYNIRLAMKKGVEVFSACDEEAVDDFYSLFELTFNRHDFRGEPLHFFKNMIRVLGASGMATLYFARYKGVLLASAVRIRYGDKATYLYGGSSPFLSAAMANYALQWRMMTDARDQGCRLYDFYGIAPESEPEHGYAKFSQFKLRFGGRKIETVGAHDIYVYEQLADLWAKNMVKASELSEVAF